MALNIDQYNLLQRGVTRFCWLVSVTAVASKGGDVERLALHNEDIVFAGHTYKAVPFEISEFQSAAGMEINNATFTTVLYEALNRLNIRGSKWQGAYVELVIVDYANTPVGFVQRHYGRFGEATVYGYQVQIEYRGLMQILSQEIGDKTSRLCRYQLGDARCTKNLASVTFPGSVTAVANKQKFNISVAKPDGYFYRGQIKFTSGDNIGLSMETQNNTGTELMLFMPMLGSVEVGDTFEIIAGDDKTLHTCHQKFGNGINFGGEPLMPTKDRLYKFPD